MVQHGRQGFTPVFGVGGCCQRNGKVFRFVPSTETCWVELPEPTMEHRRLPRVAYLARVAVVDACGTGSAGERTVDQAGIILGSQQARVELIERAQRLQLQMRLPGYCDPNCFVGSISSVIPGVLAKELGMHGLITAVTHGRLSGIDAIGLAHLLMQPAHSSILFAGGADSAKAMELGEALTDCREGAGVVGLGQPPLGRAGLGVGICAYWSGIVGRDGWSNLKTRLPWLDACVLRLQAVVIGHRDGPQSQIAADLAASLGVEQICTEADHGCAGCATGALAVVHAVRKLCESLQPALSAAVTDSRAALAMDGSTDGWLSLVVLTTGPKE
jgi:hypothetical protein